jgi:hypothetical protein
MGRFGCLQSIADLVDVAISMASDPPARCTLHSALCPLRSAPPVAAASHAAEPNLPDPRLEIIDYRGVTLKILLGAASFFCQTTRPQRPLDASAALPRRATAAAAMGS